MGRAISLQLAEAGANVAVSDIDASTAEDTAVAVKQLGRESIVLPADMGDLQDIDRMFRQAKDAFGRIDVVVNNAGVTKYLDIMMNAMPSYFVYMPQGTMAIVEGLLREGLTSLMSVFRRKRLPMPHLIISVRSTKVKKPLSGSINTGWMRRLRLIF
jgi:NAD(P)-dependent dehydrogenase (short-subunit alcohol dehydrogenase family)